MSQKVIHVQTDSQTGITGFDCLPDVGASTLALRAKIGEQVLQVFPVRTHQILEEGLKSDPNFAFKAVNTPLFPNTNRLLPDQDPSGFKLNDEFTATVKGIQVKMPLNNQASSAGAIPHQLHGLLFDQRPIAVRNDPEGSKVVATFENFFRGYWTGSSRVTIEQAIESNAFIYRMNAVNTGRDPMPVGFGTHPYFNIPGGDAAQVKLVIPSRHYAEIDNLQNVLPTGRLLPTQGSALDFNAGSNTRIAGRLLDNYFLLDTPIRKVELVDLKKAVKYRMTALTQNIVGVQIFYPGQGEIIAIEMVTHHPDPREALWKSVPTGMQILQPGESASYAYKIEVLPA